MGINCGSLEKELHQLYCYLILGMLDVVRMQEKWALMPNEWLNGLPYQQVAPLPFLTSLGKNQKVSPSHQPQPTP